MNTKTALRVENVSKQYRIYEHPGDRLKETLTRGRWKWHREFWALRDISFEVEAGTTTGIIGPNGCGKSTLLQIVTGTLEPTHGEVWCDGRVSALLELGAGFNPEFTGVENVFMNGALLGFSRKEMTEMLPGIERFAELGDFLHQPVKTYSSGMYVRLAFAVAISVDPQILIVDEALAVGDAVFQHRCMRRIRELQEAGVTILFVSHDPGAIRALCSRAILLNQGRAIADGKPVDVLNQYQKIIMAREEAYEESESTEGPEDAENEAPLDGLPDSLQYNYRHGDGTAVIRGVQLSDSLGRRTGLIETGETLLVRVGIRFNADVEHPVCGLLIRNRHGIHVYGTNTELQRVEFGPVRRNDRIEVTFTFEAWLAPDTYTVTLAVHSVDAISFDWLDDVLFFQVISPTTMDGVANLNARISTRALTRDADKNALADTTLSL
jgi:ABC-type polysaccharide/polyol phosphate transport system ATPase subunit